jgi:formylglycine-generating enzyme required for sulfatase activity
MKTARTLSFTIGVAAWVVGCSLFVGLDGLQSGDAAGDAASADAANDGSRADGATSDASADDASTPPSCASGGGGTCAGGDCCQSLIVPGGTFNRDNSASFPATVSDFKLDRFKVTVGRFRAFVNANGPATTDNPPAAGVGAHPTIPNSGWDPAWNAKLHANETALISALKCDPNATWTDTVGPNESLPISCINWYLAFAFCAWDGGRLATEAEWNYAAAGGSEQRYWPWSSPPSSQVIDHSYADYECGHDGGATYDTCPLSAVTRPGNFSPKGDGKWGHADLVGSFLEWELDWGYPNAFPLPCSDCATLADVADAGVRSDRPLGGIAYPYGSQTTFNRNSDPPANGGYPFGIRCARNP